MCWHKDRVFSAEAKGKGGQYLATTHGNTEWQNKITVKKGDFAEEIIRGFLEEKGFVIYEPITNGAHCFDKISG